MLDSRLVLTRLLSPTRPLALSTLLLVSALCSPPAYAESTDSESAKADEDKSEPSMSPGLLPTLVAIVPGLALHGLGHYVAGDRKTASRLFHWQLVGMGMMLGSALALAYSGGSRYGNELTIPTLIAGNGIFFNTFIADVYGSAGGGSVASYQPAPQAAASLGYGYIYDPQFSYNHFAVATGHLRWGQTHIDPSLWVAVGSNNQRARLPLGYGLLASDVGEYLEITGALTYHSFADSGFATYLGEAGVGARVEMSRLGAALRGSFSTASVGLGWHHVDFDIPDGDGDSSALLIAHFGYGFYLPAGGELEMYYQHRRDDFTSGTSPGSRNGSGFLGHYGAKLRKPLSDRFALRLQSEIGAAWLLGSSLEVRLGGTP